jgi:putative cardiolipin synthase
MAYLILRRGFIAAMLASLAACASVQPGAGFPKPESHALEPATGGTLAAIADRTANLPEAQSGFRMLSAGIDGLLARVEVIDAARRSLDLQYYIFRGDQSGLIVASALLRAAERGVRVRLIVDDGESVRGDEKILAMAAHAGIEIRLFNPFRYRGHSWFFRGTEFLFNKSRLDYRMHNKLLVADNSVVLIGGRNIGDQYFQIDPESQFGDDDLITAGPIVRKLSDVFDEFWNSAEAVPVQAVDRKHTSAAALAGLRAAISADELPPVQPISDFAKRLAAGEPLGSIIAAKTPLIASHARLVYDSPDKKHVTAGMSPGNLIYDAVADEAKSVSTEMLAVTPYLVPSPDELQTMKSERDRNAAVRILTNSLQSAPDLAAHAGYMHYRPAMLQAGIQLYEIRSLLGSTRGSGQGKAISRHGHYSLHGKIYVFDRRSIFVGSLNLDQRSKLLNTEIGLIIHSPSLAEQAALRFEALSSLDNSYTVELRAAESKSSLVWKTRESGVVREYTKEPARNEWQKFRVNVLTLLPLDKEL